ncbi:unnamed protein product [Effrenium voratum]|nr:unnamed protein product [Effrenium voratum]
MVTVSLVSGNSVVLPFSGKATVGQLKAKAQQHFQKGLLTLVAEARILDPDLTLEEAEIHKNSAVLACVEPAKLGSSRWAMVLALHTSMRCAVWGDLKKGGDCRNVQAQLKQVSSTEGAFVALSEEHRAVCWGESSMGGRLPDDLGDVRLVRGTSSAFAALMTDGRVLAWGNRQAGGDIPAAAAAELGRGSVVELCASSGAFAALKADGSVVTWGNPKAGGDSSAVQEQLKQVTQIARCLLAFAAVLADGRVVCWGGLVQSGLQDLDL